MNEEPPYWKVSGFEPLPLKEDEESMGSIAASASAAAQPNSGKSSGKPSEMRENEEHTGGRLKKRKTYRKKRRWLKSINRKRTGSKRASRSSNR